MTAKTKKIIRLAILAIMLGLVMTGCMGPSGCTGPGIQGWSGFASSNKLIYVGSMDGTVLAVNPSVRRAGVNFPNKDQGEWEYMIKVQSTGNICGSFLSCGQETAASKMAIYSSPVVSQDLIYVGTYIGQVRAISRLEPTIGDEFPSRKKNEWVFPKDKYIGAIVGNLVLNDDTLYICSTDGKVYALDAKYGDKKWDFPTNERIWTSPAVSDGVVYVGSYDGKLYAISSRDGKLIDAKDQDGRQIWPLDLRKDLGTTMCSSPVVSGDSIYFGAFDRYLYALNKTDAKIRWKFPGGNWFWATPIVKGNTVYAGCLDNNIYAIDAITGTQLWQFAADTPIISSPVAVADLVIAVAESGNLYLINAASGTVRKTVPLGSKVMAPLYAIENVIYVHSRDNAIHAIDIQSGEFVWKFKKSSKQE